MQRATPALWKALITMAVAANTVPMWVATATHDGTGWWSDAGLDTPPGTATAFGPNTTHGGPDGPAEPNFGDSRPGSDRNADRSIAGGVARPWGNRIYAPICQNPNTNVTDPIPHFGEVAETTGGSPPIFFREDVGNVTHMRDGTNNTTAADILFFDNVWFFGFPVGVNVNGAAQGQDNDASGFSDPAEAYSAAFDSTNATAPKKPRAWVSSDATPAFAIAWFGNWTDGRDGAGGGGFRDNVINLTGVNATNNNAEWVPYRGAAPQIRGFFDPYNFVSIVIDPDNGIGQAIGGVDNITGDPPPIDPDSPGNDFQNNATNYVVGRVGFLSNPSNVTDNATEIINGISNFTQNPQQTNTTVTVDCEIEIDYIQFRTDQRYDSVAIYLIDDVPGRQVTTTVWHDANFDNRTFNGTVNHSNGSATDGIGDDRVDIDQYCTQASNSGVDASPTPPSCVQTPCSPATNYTYCQRYTSAGTIVNGPEQYGCILGPGGIPPGGFPCPGMLGVAACNTATGATTDGAGGVCLGSVPAGGSVTVNVTDDVFGASVSFGLCIDQDADQLCRPELGADAMALQNCTMPAGPPGVTLGTPTGGQAVLFVWVDTTNSCTGVAGRVDYNVNGPPPSPPTVPVYPH